MEARKQQHRDRWRSDQAFQDHRGAGSYAFRRPQIPGGLLSRACHTLPCGILVVSAQGTIDFYNRAYAQLRGISPGALLGQPVDMIERRHRLRELLHTGTLPPERRVPDERRKNHEIILPLRNDDLSLIGVVVVIAGADWWLNGVPGSSSQQLSPRDGREGVRVRR
jgi:PAS domain-containing protein